ncbi:pyridoxal phosphate-dependent aminotransferase [Neptunomonas concharum]|uniref:Aminotransferase n=1 Tax=Neptunomonas concharum TaxID=1031538 RepID=A0A5P1RE70_9GAMM|nr:pyridoxal phosphate-dependent aminotransferase [Neptunomonas concharum]QEQ97940.1 pyridoxal phosphate-dependent aminotransferase [Neptunomonas concharum]
MQDKWTSRAKEIESFKVMDLLKRAKQLDAEGFDVIHMEAGEPDFGTAPRVKEAAHQAIDQGLTQYTPAAGIPELRQAIARFYEQRYGLKIDASRVIVTSGASGALLMVFGLLADPETTFMMADPGYPCNRQFLRMLDARSQLVPTTAAEKFQLTPDLIKREWHQRTAGVLIASPANPTGSVLHKEELQGVADAVKQQGGVLVVDELYHGLTYGFDAPSILEIEPDAFVINSFSKYFGMTGWRLGWIVAPESAVPELEKLAQNLYISPPTVSQYAALAAFDDESLEEFERRRHQFELRRDLLVEGLRKLGFDIPLMPEGAFYVYADASHLTDNTYDYCWRLLEEAHVAATPGLDFGSYRANQFIRFSYTTGLDRIELMLKRLAAFIKN